MTGFSEFEGYRAGSSAVVGNNLKIFYAIHSVAIICILFTFIGSCYVIINSVRTKALSTLYERFPVYLCLSNLVFACVHLCDHVVVTAHKRYPSAPIGRLLGAIVICGWGYQVTCQLLLAVQCYLKIILQRRLPLGKYEWKLQAAVMAVVLSIMIAGLGSDAFGPGPYFVIFNVGNTPGRVMWVITALYLLTTTLVVLLTTHSIRRKIRAATQDIKKHTREQVREHKTNMADARMLNFAIISCVQYIPTIILINLFLWHDDVSAVNKFFYFVGLATVNSGGTMNCLVYIYNEKTAAAVSDLTTSSSGDGKSGQKSHSIGRKGGNIASALTAIGNSKDRLQASNSKDRLQPSIV
ncbi:hypothetical protein BC832DRAFT_591830 [Gaertneriomyces semiglobifer]|nr:hypothetical protein BC832DRAFT_591830 [Gaertneriomyces semiglobifer]